MIDVSIETHPWLYDDPYRCAEFCASIPDLEIDASVKDRTIFHMFWNVLGDGDIEFGRKQLLPLRSFLATQDLEHTVLWIWSNRNLMENTNFLHWYEFEAGRLTIDGMKPVVLKHYDVWEESKDTPLENYKVILEAADDKNWAQGDVFRLLALYNYGGVYVDFDVAFLRDFTPLLDQDFMYNWSWKPNMMNGAIMHFRRASDPMVYTLLMGLSQTTPCPRSEVWSTQLYSRIHESVRNLALGFEWTVFPCGFFDPEWSFKLTKEQKDNPVNAELMRFIRNPFSRTKYNHHLFPGTFAWHWHGDWDKGIEEGSKWQIIEQYILDLTEKKAKALYQ